MPLGNYYSLIHTSTTSSSSSATTTVVVAAAAAVCLLTPHWIWLSVWETSREINVIESTDATAAAQSDDRRTTNVMFWRRAANALPGVAKVRSEGFHLAQSVTLLGPVCTRFRLTVNGIPCIIAVLRWEKQCHGLTWLSAGLDVLTYLLTYSRIRTC